MLGALQKQKSNKLTSPRTNGVAKAQSRRKTTVFIFYQLAVEVVITNELN